MIVGIRILYCFLAITLLSGCWAPGYIPGDHGKSKALNSDVLDALIGQSWELVVEKLGKPGKQFTLDDRQFMLYFTYVSRTYYDVIVVPIPIPTGTTEIKTELLCLMIELGSDNLVKQYKLKYGMVAFTPLDERPITKCQRHYFNKKEREMIYKVVTRASQRDSFIKPSGEIDLSGVYEARITRERSADYSCFNQKRTFFFQLNQKNKTLEGKFLSGITGKFEGTLNQDKVSFTYYTTRCSKPVDGEWTLDSDGSSLEGYGWSEIKWKLHRI